MLRFIGICLFHPGLGNPDTSRLRSHNDLPFRDAVSNSKMVQEVIFPYTKLQTVIVVKYVLNLKRVKMNNVNF